ncbi:MAG: hypothetical protein ACTHPD_03035 [Rhizomicrobium sp.]
MKPKILLVYAALNHPLRANTKNLIECFRQYGDAHWYYLNLAHKRAPAYVAAVDFDLIIFQTTFTQRLSRSDAYYELMTRRAARLRVLPAPKVALAQDEFWNVAKVERFIEEFGIKTVFSVAPETEWPVLYPSIDPQRVKFHRVLTGYLDDETLDRMIDAGKSAHRSKDVVYRAAGRPSPAWGRFGFLKQRLADAVAQIAPQLGLRTDVSTDPKDTLFGDDWIRFLANARYTIGVPSGSSLLDRDGRITRCVESYCAANPGASFEDVERHCFPGMDGNLRLSAIGPRHIEACATRTCQILVEGDYNGLLKPNVHYLAVREDLSNLPDVLANLGDEEVRKRIVEAAFDDIVRPQRITYRCFVSEVLDNGLPNGSGGAQLRLTERCVLSFMCLVDALEWQLALVFSGLVRKLRDLFYAGDRA